MRALQGASIRLYGGSSGLRAADLLESAVSRPFTRLYGQLAYGIGVHQAAALLESRVNNHPCIDGNKRTALYTRVFFFQECGYWSDVTLLSKRELERLESVILGIGYSA